MTDLFVHTADFNGAATDYWG